MIGYKFAGVFFCAVLLRGCDSKIVVDPVPMGSEAPANGVIYALPNTVVRMQLKVDKTTKKGAPFVSYAAIFAPEGKPLCKAAKCTPEEETTYSLQNGSTFATYGEPDPENVFLVKFVGKGAIDQTLSMTWNEAGLLSATASTVTNRTGDVVLSALKMAAGLGTRGFGGVGDSKTIVCSVPSTQDKWVLILLKKELFYARTLIENYCAIDYREREKLDPSVHKDPLTAAYNAYIDRVAPLVKAQINILTAESDSSEPTSLLPRIESEISRELATLYLGTKETLTWDATLDVRRVEESTAIPVLRVNPIKGICLGESEIPPATKPVPSDINQLQGAECTSASPVLLTLDLYPVRDKQLFTKIREVATGDRSFRYRVAAQVKATLADANKSYGSGVFSVAQLGRVISLPASRRSKSLTYELAFIESTGALKTFKLGSVGILDTATVDALSGVGGTLLDARKKEPGEADILTQQYQLLKLKDDICSIQKKYGLPCTVEPK